MENSVKGMGWLMAPQFQYRLDPRAGRNLMVLAQWGEVSGVPFGLRPEGESVV